MGFDGSHTFIIGIEINITDLIENKIKNIPGCKHNIDRVKKPNSFCSVCGNPAWKSITQKAWTPAFHHLAEKYPDPNDTDINEALEEIYKVDVIEDRATNDDDAPRYLGTKLGSYDNRTDGSGTYTFQELTTYFSDLSLIQLSDTFHKPVQLWVVNTSSY